MDLWETPTGETMWLAPGAKLERVTQEDGSFVYTVL
jgi:hypothetical protein